MSSGIHHNDAEVFHWCDVETVDRARIPEQPLELSKPVEATLIIVCIHTHP